MIVLATIVKNEKVLLVKHSSSLKPDYGDWLLPGGSVKTGESLENALKREIIEETGLEIEIVRKIDERADSYTDDWFTNFLCIPLTSSINTSSELSDAMWFDCNEIKMLENIHPGLRQFLIDSFDGTFTYQL